MSRSAADGKTPKAVAVILAILTILPSCLLQSGLPRFVDVLVSCLHVTARDIDQRFDRGEGRMAYRPGNTDVTWRIAM